MSDTVRLTPFQQGEVEALLADVADERDNGSTDEDGWVVWGRLEGNILHVLDATAAVGDLEHRADFLTDEADTHTGGIPGARSLRNLASTLRGLA